MPHEIKECPFVPGFGHHPAHWRTAETTFAASLAVCQRLDAALDSLCRAGYRLAGEDSFKLAMVDLGVPAKTALGELALMIGNGYGVGGLKITRTLMEYGINATYLVSHDDEEREVDERDRSAALAQTENYRAHLPNNVAGSKFSAGFLQRAGLGVSEAETTLGRKS